MGIKSRLSRPFAKIIANKVKKASSTPIRSQDLVFQELMNGGRNTAFGKDHDFGNIKNYEDFKARVPVRDYEALKPYFERMIKGEKDVLWKGKPIYLAKTSGTTSGAKYIPISKESISNHINGARNALLCYIAETGNAGFVDGKMIFLSGSPVLDTNKAIPTGRLSGIVNHHVPNYLTRNRMPSWETNCIEDWETKVDAIVDETLKEDMTLISGIPSWVQMYFERIQEKTGKKIKDVFPNFSVFVYGGVNYEPYRAKFENLIGKRIDSIELFPASEGFFAYQDSQHADGMLLIVDSGIFYEFIPADEFFNENPTRVSLKDVELDVNYALIVNNNAGLWGYNIGDTVKFVSKDPYRVKVTGRIKHFTSAFGEHVIAEEVEHALKVASKGENVEVAEFTVAPQVNPENGQLPYHEWLVVFHKEPENMESFRLKIDKALQEKNIYYSDLIKGKILQPLIIRSLRKDAFIEYMKSQGKLGGQNKIPRLTNDRKIADELMKFILVENE